jgi:hypothetical protein
VHKIVVLVLRVPSHAKVPFCLGEETKLAVIMAGGLEFLLGWLPIKGHWGLYTSLLETYMRLGSFQKKKR